MEYKALVEQVAEQRRVYEGILTRLYSGDTSALFDLDDTVFTDRNKDIFWWNATMMKGNTRRSGVPYYTHPASAAFLVSVLTDEGPEREKAIGYVLTHDLLDEALGNDVRAFRRLRSEIGEEYADELDAAVLLCAPSERSMWDVGIVKVRVAQKVAVLKQVQKYGTRAHAYALVADNLDNMLDTKFLDRRGPDKKKDYITRWLLARSFFVLGCLGETIPDELRQRAFAIMRGVMRENDILEDTVRSTEFMYVGFSELDFLAESHARKYGFGT